VGVSSFVHKHMNTEDSTTKTDTLTIDFRRPHDCINGLQRELVVLNRILYQQARRL